MSVSDPLIKELKSHANRLLTESPRSIQDADPHVTLFCECLERILCHGLHKPRSVIGIIRVPSPWVWLEQAADEKYGGPYSYISSVENVKRCGKVKTDRGKVRLLIRLALTRRCIHYPVQFINRDSRRYSFYTPQSIVGDCILCELLLSVLMIVSRLEFNLDVNNSVFLDDTWKIPASISLQLCPSRTLGVTVMFIDGKAVVVDILENSLAAECEEIVVGDILDSLNGMPVNDSVQGTMLNVMKRVMGQPLELYIIKCASGSVIFPQMVPILKQAGLNPQQILDSISIKKKNRDNEEDAASLISYVGNVDTGTRGDVKQIFFAINELVKSGRAESLPVTIECHDLGIKVLSGLTQKVLFEHPYMEISSCGSSTSGPLYFAYIAGDENFSNCKNFKCYIFRSLNPLQVESLLKTIGQGFKRTLFTV
ncbi:hypothetical protein GE061_003163 [Apolygus lucorum]|uniref:PID domain-containing protein n=1 Tax=Apolygus lucorum TaxID=248454 RepID=A0A6A4JGL5_APOLU|nr:hypothetical protein GE061_003163 [Apolygus lucorum]